MTTRPAPDFLRIPLLIALGCGILLALLFLLVEPVVSVVIVVILAAVAAAANRIGIDVTAAPRVFLGAMLARETITLQPLPRWQAAVEILAVLFVVAMATQRYYTAGADIQLSGGEAEWIMSSAYAAHDGLRDYGRIPLWQPYLEFGEPLVDNPVSFVLNPFSTAPSLILGGPEGMKISVVLTTAVAGLGGWFLGRVLGFGALGRLLLGMLLVGKGNMSAMFNTGYFQLAASQAYFPWIIAGTIGIFYQPKRRWPPVMLALSWALLLFVGNIWYTLPMALCVTVIALAYLIRRPGSISDSASVGARHVVPTLDGEVSPSLRSGEGCRRRGGRGLLSTRYSELRTLFFAALLTVAISAALFIPLWLHQSMIGNHPPEVEAGWVVPLWRSAVQFYFNPDPRQMIFRVMDPLSGNATGYYMDALEEIYYSYVAPGWLVLLLFVLIPIYRPRGRRIWLAAWVLLAFFTLWGSGGQPLFVFLYEKIPFLQGWRFVGRALGVGSFWIAVLIAMRADSLWHFFLNLPGDWFSKITARLRISQSSLLKTQSLLSLVTRYSLLITLFAAWDTASYWNSGVNNILNPINRNAVCLNWLRAQNPGKEITVWEWGYNGITAYLHNKVRMFDVLSDFEMSPMPNTIGHIDLTRSMPEYGIAWTTGDRKYLRDNGYKPIPKGPRTPLPGTHFSCLYQRKDVLSYAYTVPLSTLEALKPPDEVINPPPPPTDIILAPDQTVPVTTYLRQPDNITLLVNGDPEGETILTLQERAFPGWEVHIDGAPARLESVGGQLGVILPSDDQPHIVYFVYRPPLLFLGAAITLLASLFCILYLLRVDRFFRKNASALTQPTPPEA